MKASSRMLVTVALLFAANTTYSQIQMSGRTFDVHQIVRAQGQLHYPYIGQATFDQGVLTGACWGDDGAVYDVARAWASSALVLANDFVQSWDISEIFSDGYISPYDAELLHLMEMMLSEPSLFGTAARFLVRPAEDRTLLEFYCVRRPQFFGVPLPGSEYFYGIEVAD